MRKSLVSVFALSCLFAVGAAYAADPAPQAASASAPIHWKYRLTDTVATNTDAQGKVVSSLNVGVVDYFLGVIAGYANAYPTQFENDDQRADVTGKLRRLATLLGELDTGDSVDVNILRREAYAYELAYKFGFAASGPQAMALYQKLMARTPDDPVANFQYGSFLAENDTLRPQSVPYLEKAVSLGMKKANYTLGITYIAMGQNEKGLGYLQQYSTDYPNDLQAKNLIAAVKSGAIKSPPHP